VPPASSSAAVKAAHHRDHRWNDGGRTVAIAISDSGGDGPAWLLLPALSTISSRSEWEPFADALRDGGQRLDRQRPHLPYDAGLLARCLADLRREVCPPDCGLLAAERHGLTFREWVLVAPTWRGPLPTMAGSPPHGRCRVR
jgi:hypothetical protein